MDTLLWDALLRDTLLEGSLWREYFPCHHIFFMCERGNFVLT